MLACHVTPSGAATARVLFDGTHGLAVNTRTKIGDQGRSPIASDLKRPMRVKHIQDECTFALTPDVSVTHPRDWHLLGSACAHKYALTGEVYIHTACTFGVASSLVEGRVGMRCGRAACWWPTSSSTCSRAVHHIGVFFFCVLRVVSSRRDPFVVEQDSQRPHSVWVGFVLLHRTRSLGISQRRAD